MDSTAINNGQHWQKKIVYKTVGVRQGLVSSELKPGHLNLDTLKTIILLFNVLISIQINLIFVVAVVVYDTDVNC